MRRDRWQRLGAGFVVAAGLAACGGGGGGTVASTTTTGPPGSQSAAGYVDIYAGLPLRGPMAREGGAVLRGIRLALKYVRPHPGDLKIEFKKLNNSGRKTGDDNLALTAANAGTVATDPRAVYYIGDLGSAEAAVSGPVLDAAGIAQVTPGDPYIAPPQTASGAPAPTSTLLRLLPSYTVQAAADVLSFTEIPPQLKDLACTHVLAVAEDDPESMALVRAMYTDAKADAIEMPKPTILTSKTSSLTQYETALHLQSRATCGFVIAGSQTKPAVTLTKAIHSIFPQAFIVGTSGICNSKWTRAEDRGVPAVIDPWLWCTSPVLPLDQYHGSADFVKLYKTAHHGSYPSQYAFYGYEAAELGIGMIENLGASAANRRLMRDNLFDAQLRDSIFLPYGLLINHDSTLTSYGVYRVDPKTATPRFYTTLRP